MKKERESKLVKAWKITPAGQRSIEAIYVIAGKTWDHVLSEVSYSMEQQIESTDGSGNYERPWDEMKTVVEGVLLTAEEVAELW